MGISADEVGEKHKDKLESIQHSKAIYVHYIGFTSKYDEWIIVTDETIFCDLKQISKETTHRLAQLNTQSEYKKKLQKKKKEAVKEEEEEIEKIKYKITDFDALVEYIGNKYEAPSGSNRNGIGAEKFAHAQKH